MGTKLNQLQGVFAAVNLRARETKGHTARRHGGSNTGYTTAQSPGAKPARLAASR